MLSLLIRKFVPVKRIFPMKVEFVKLAYVVILSGVLMAAGCHDEKELQPATPQPRAEAERTVIVYMVADNQPHLPVRQDTTEMARGKNLIPEDINFIVYLDDNDSHPAIYELSARRGMQLWKSYDKELCSTDSLTMLNVLREIEYYFPARHYGITFWSHASGWAPERMNARRNTFGKDENHGQTASLKNEMEIPVLRDVLAHFPMFDYIFFDACFMQCIEVAYELKAVTQYMVGSPAEIPGPGAPYDKIVTALCSGDAKGIVQGYVSGYPGTYEGIYYPGVLLSCIDCTRLEALATATGQLLTPLYMGRREQSTYGFQVYCDNFSRNRNSKFPYYFDMRTTMCRLVSPEDYAEWMEIFKEAVPLRTFSSTGKWYASFCSRPVIQRPECYGGVSMFIPLGIYEGYGWIENFRKTSWYGASGWDVTGW